MEIMNKIIINTPAKINLFLKVLGKRPDGFHNIYSWFQTVSLYDRLTFEIRGDEIRFNVIGTDKLPADDNNLVVRAIKLMFSKFGIKSGIYASLEKRIPISAGLGGGSSDAAATIFAINELFNLNLDNLAMAEIGAELGSDIPFFFSSGQAEVTGRGEIIKNISLPTDYEIMLITPPVSISTKAAYQSLKIALTLENGVVKLPVCKGFDGLIANLCKFENDFEIWQLNAFPELKEVHDFIIGNGAVITRMSGSGPSFFGMFKTKPEGVTQRPQIIQNGWELFIVQPLTSTFRVE